MSALSGVDRPGKCRSAKAFAQKFQDKQAGAAVIFISDKVRTPVPAEHQVLTRNSRGLGRIFDGIEAAGKLTAHDIRPVLLYQCRTKGLNDSMQYFPL